MRQGSQAGVTFADVAKVALSALPDLLERAWRELAPKSLLDARS